MVSHTAFCNFIGNLWFRIQLSEMSLEIDGFAYSFLQFHWKSMVSHTAFYNFIGNPWFRIQRSVIALEI